MSPKAKATYTCPVCKRTSHHPMDARLEFCVACGGMTSAPVPEGFAWVPFRGGGALDGCYRLLELATLEPGSTYERVLSADVYRFDGEAFKLEAAA